MSTESVPNKQIEETNMTKHQSDNYAVQNNSAIPDTQRSGSSMTQQDMGKALTSCMLSPIKYGMSPRDVIPDMSGMNGAGSKQQKSPRILPTRQRSRATPIQQLGPPAMMSPQTWSPILHTDGAPTLARKPSYTEQAKAYQLALKKALTFGVIGEDSATYPSSRWVSENRDQYDGQGAGNKTPRENFTVTSLDFRKHNPQTSQLFHIRRINKKPVCSVQWMDTGKEPSDNNSEQSSVYSTSFKQRTSEPRHIVYRNEKETHIEGNIVPIKLSNSHYDVRSEMMLPVCDSTAISSAPNPHKYLLRKRKVPSPHKDNWGENGIMYPPPDYSSKLSTQINRPQTSSPGNLTMSLVKPPERVSISTLSGHEFTRRKYIPPPSNHIINGFDGGVPETDKGRFSDRNMAFMRCKTII